MEEVAITLGTDASRQLLDSGHLVVSVFMLTITILLAILGYTIRLWREERKETLRLNSIIVDMVGKMIEAVKDSRKQVETLTKVLLNGNNR